MFKKIESKVDLPKVESEILEFWDKEKIFEESLEIRKSAKRYSFYDGPPFATGTPHYGHIVASTMKDVVPRYWTMRGYYVERVWGWDCHGLPIENIAEKSLGITHKKEILEMGVEKFNNVCRSKIAGYIEDWERVIRRLGRWVDMKNSYRTMDLPYMESVWWAFRELWDKGLIYEGYRSMHICPRCETTLSQSEVSEGYKDVKDISVIAEFRLKDSDNTSILAWTTTPWTLLGNVALAVGEDIEYVEIEKKDLGVDGKVHFILAKDRLEEVFEENDYKFINKFTGKELVGRSYKPLFDYYAGDKNLKNRENGWKIYAAEFVTTEEGTGVVHIAPAFGEDDMKLGEKYSLPFVQHVGMDGVVKAGAGEFAGMHVKPIGDTQMTDVAIIKYLSNKNLLFDKKQYLHSYPHCWRCETPLINYATSSLFVNVTKIKNEALDLAKSVYWSPGHIKEGRFGKWLEGARDWSISRQRFWASCIPIWVCDECQEKKVIGSVGELEKLSGEKVTDLHKEVVDKIKLPCSGCGGEMKRVPDVLDCWFESGSMPYAQLHYPFQNKEEFEKSFPADFVAEGSDHTRAWFYYLHVIATAIKNKPAFKNAIVNGIVLAEDGKKMSKRLQNYPDPTEMFDKYGADVMRFYLLNQPVMQAENMNFTESDMADISRGMFRMLWNSYSFFVLYANIDEWQPKEGDLPSDNVLDKWILAELNNLAKELNYYMEKYDLMRSSRLFAPFIDNLSNWFIRRSRKRFWKSENDADKNSAYQTLFTILVALSKLMAPFTPFIAEEIYKNLTGKKSVHLDDYPQPDLSKIDNELIGEMKRTRTIVEMGLSERANNNIKVRQPLAEILYGGKKLGSDFLPIIAEEVNVKTVTYDKDLPENKIELDINITQDLLNEGAIRELIRNIQSLRKSAGFDVENRINLYYWTESSMADDLMKEYNEMISKEVLANKITRDRNMPLAKDTYKIGEFEIQIGLERLV